MCGILSISQGRCFCLGDCGNLTFALSLPEPGEEGKHERTLTCAVLLRDSRSISRGFREWRPDIFTAIHSSKCQRWSESSRTEQTRGWTEENNSFTYLPDAGKSKVVVKEVKGSHGWVQETAAEGIYLFKGRPDFDTVTSMAGVPQSWNNRCFCERPPRKVVYGECISLGETVPFSPAPPCGRFSQTHTHSRPIMWGLDLFWAGSDHLDVNVENIP